MYWSVDIQKIDQRQNMSAQVNLQRLCKVTYIDNVFLTGALRPLLIEYGIILSSIAKINILRYIDESVN